MLPVDVETGRSLLRSAELCRRAREIILGGSQTISKQPERYDAERFPAYIESGRGCRLMDVDGNEYIDYVMALGPVILGYCYPAVDKAVREQLARGVLFSGNSPLEVHLAEKLVSTIPNAGCVRYFKSGAEATSAAVRLARNFTGRDKVVSCGYSGWHDWWTVKKSEPGIPAALRPLTLDLPYGDINRARELFRTAGTEIACAVIETVVLDCDPDFLHETIQLAHAAGALVVLDEIITGFRTGVSGIQGRFGLNADLATFGKAIANGFPLSAVTGRKEIFDAARDLWISTTFGGETLSLAAALATIAELEDPALLPRMEGLGERLMQGWKQTLERFCRVRADVTGLPTIPVLRFQDGAKKQQDQFIAGMLDRGFITRRNHYWFITASHTEGDIDSTLAACERTFREIHDSGAA
jgi:glutamate-1-semialdehyde 2,1-aminomutase